MSQVNKLIGYYKFEDGRKGWCKPVLEESTSISYDDGFYTVLPDDHPYLKDAEEIKTKS